MKEKSHEEVNLIHQSLDIVCHGPVSGVLDGQMFRLRNSNLLVHQLSTIVAMP